MKVLIVFDHPNRHSFCGAVLDAFVQGLTEAGHVAEIADLRAEGFDPRMPLVDKPDWNDDFKVYTPEVLAEQARVDRNDALAFVFPVWWWSVPATTKGWMDRVLSFGWAHGARRLPHSKALLMGVGGSDLVDYRKRGYDTAMQTQLITGIVDYCGIKDGALELIADSDGSHEVRQALLMHARELGATF